MVQIIIIWNQQYTKWVVLFCFPFCCIMLSSCTWLEMLYIVLQLIPSIILLLSSLIKLVTPQDVPVFVLTTVSWTFSYALYMLIIVIIIIIVYLVVVVIVGAYVFIALSYIEFTLQCRNTRVYPFRNRTCTYNQFMFAVVA